MRNSIIAVIFALTCGGAPAFAAPDQRPDPGRILRANASYEPAQVARVSEQEVQLWILNAGYTQVSGLTPTFTRDGRYLYRGTAIMDGETYDVVVDAQGNILGWK